MPAHLIHAIAWLSASRRRAPLRGFVVVLVLQASREMESRALLCALFPALMEWSALDILVAGKVI